MSYKRKTVDEYRVMGDYGQGMEELLTEDTYKEALEQLITYMLNDTSVHTLMIKKVRVHK